jgi:hypothetical protein
MLSVPYNCLLPEDSNRRDPQYVPPIRGPWVTLPVDLAPVVPICGEERKFFGRRLNTMGKVAIRGLTADWVIGPLVAAEDLAVWRMGKGFMCWDIKSLFERARGEGLKLPIYTSSGALDYRTWNKTCDPYRRRSPEKPNIPRFRGEATRRLGEKVLDYMYAEYPQLCPSIVGGGFFLRSAYRTALFETARYIEEASEKKDELLLIKHNLSPETPEEDVRKAEEIIESLRKKVQDDILFSLVVGMVENLRKNPEEIDRSYEARRRRLHPWQGS